MKINLGKLTFFGSLALALALASPGTLKAEKENPLTVTDGFARYDFGSVVATLSVPSPTPAGTKIPVVVEIKNSNNYPIVDGSVYVKVFKKQDQREGSEIDYSVSGPNENFLRNGDFLIDQFMALENINLLANGSAKKNFEWKVPAYLPQGEYKMASFVQSAKKFNMSGLTFTEDIVGSLTSFTVRNSEIVGTVEFDKNSAKLNGEPYDFVGFSKSYLGDEQIKIEAPLKNTTGKAQKVSVSWKVYYWDELLESNKLKLEDETVTIGPGETKTLTHTFSASGFPVDFVTVKAVYEDTSSILNFRYSWSEREKARNNFMGLTSFPLKAGEKTTVFATAHAVKSFVPFLEPFMDENGKVDTERMKAMYGTKNYKLTLALKDEGKKMVESWEYSGEITGEVMGFETDFVPKNNYNYLVLEGTIQDENGAIVDQSSLIFDCKTLGDGKCPKATVTETISQKVSSKTAKSVIFLVFLIPILIVVVRIIMKKRNNSNIVQNVKILIFILSTAAVFGMADIPGAQAGFVSDKPVNANAVNDITKQTVTFNGYLSDSAYKSVSFNSSFDFWWAVVKKVKAYVRYTGKSSAEETYLLVGDKFEIDDISSSDSSAIFWNVTGYTVDSPYGCWNDTPKNPGSACYKNVYDIKWKAPGTSYTYNYSLDAAVAFKKPDLTLNSSGPVTCAKKASGRGWNCEVTGKGNISVTLNYAKNEGRFMYKSAVTGNDGTDKKEEGEFESKLNCKKSYVANLTTGALSEKKGCLTENYNSCSNVNFCDASGGNTGVFGFSKAVPNYPSAEKCSVCATDAQNKLEIPEASMKWDYSASKPDLPPTVPVVTGPTTGHVNEEKIFKMKSTDPDDPADQIAYFINWDCGTETPSCSNLPNLDGSDVSGPVNPPVEFKPALYYDERFPLSGRVNSGVIQDLKHTWTTSGIKRFSVAACDDTGNYHCSDWSGPYEIVISPPVVTCDLSVGISGQGTVTGKNINCVNGGGDCLGENNALDSTTSLSQSAATDWKFSNWSGACSGSGSCSPKMSMNTDGTTCGKSVTATFEKDEIVDVITCGDAKTEGSEECDKGAANGDCPDAYCSNSCSINHCNENKWIEVRP